MTRITRIKRRESIGDVRRNRGKNWLFRRFVNPCKMQFCDTAAIQEIKNLRYLRSLKSASLPRRLLRPNLFPIH
jgi:hypothetical protein